MSFSLYNGRATWDAAGVMSAASRPVSFQPTNSIHVSALKTSSGFKLSWTSAVGSTYRVLYKNALNDSTWTQIGNDITATSTTTSYTDTTSTQANQRFYVVARIN
jgi:hypothetical protein